MITEQTNLTTEQMRLLDRNNIPKHVAIIPDGNRRWARKNFVLPEKGHQVGADTLMDIVLAGKEMGIETLTFFIFSTENWNRPKLEVRAQMNLLEKYLIEQTPRMVRNGVRFHTIGDLSPFSDKIKKIITQTKKLTEECDTINIVFALNYGGRSEICRAFQKIVSELAITDLEGHNQSEELNHEKSQKLNKELITESLISSYMDTAEFGDPDLLIRTSGESRISNFLLWQLSYAEIYLANEYWPEFSSERFFDAIIDYQKRDRRRGGS